MAQSQLFDNLDDQQWIDAYASQKRTLDDLPYTESFEQLYQQVTGGRDAAISRAQVFHKLHNLRKAGRMPRLGRSPQSVTKIDPEQERVLVALVREKVGDLSKRDRLPYTDAMADLVTRFNEQAGLNLEPYQVWRIIAKLAK